MGPQTCLFFLLYNAEMTVLTESESKYIKHASENICKQKTK